MKAAIVCTFDTYFDRVRLLKEYYELNNNEVIIITSNFSHRTKREYLNDDADRILSVRPYYRNLSIDRLQSHYEFSQKAKKEIEKIKPDLIHCFIPANSLTKTMAEYKKEHNVKLYFDIIDLWPETMPIKRFKNVFPFSIWKNIRDKYLKYADGVFTECDLFKQILNKSKDTKFKTLHWARKESLLESQPILKNDEINFCYLGSINNIIDMDLIIKFLSECQQHKRTTLHIIGDGEGKESFVELLLEAGICVMDHKIIYDQNQKQEIFDNCNYALNIMKTSVAVGLTMKSLDYMCGQIPLINTIQGDTARLCNEMHIGYNITMNNCHEIASIACNESLEKNIEKRKRIGKVYENSFTKKTFFKTLDSMFKAGEM